MKTLKENNALLTEKLGLEYLPVALLFADSRPEDAMHLKKAGSACVAPLIFAASKGKTVAIDKDSTGYQCSAFYLGYRDWIFEGIEYFLSNSEEPLPGGRACERFVESPKLAKEYVTSFIPKTLERRTYVFKPVKNLRENEEPQVVIFYANPDQMSALVFLINYQAPNDFNRIETGFASACNAVTTFPLSYVEKNQKKAFWGLHDPSQRLSFPPDIASMAMPFSLYSDILSFFEDSFIYTHAWEKVLERIVKNRYK
jgi:hypothetical protein